MQQTGRSSNEVLLALRKAVVEGEFTPGEFLPPERQLATRFSVAQNTVRRALKGLEVERLVVAEARQGYRVLSKANDPQAGCPIAFINWNAEPSATWTDIHAELLTELKLAADRRGWSLLAMSAGQLKPAEILERLKTSRVCAVALSVKDEALVQAIKSTGLPMLMLDEWIEGSGVDSIMQDGHQGGLLAAKHLLAQGCRRIAWLGALDKNTHSLTRFGGAAAGLAESGRYLAKDLVQVSPPGEELACARKLLSGDKRPDGVIALWLGQIKAVCQAASELNLKIGTDVKVVGWSREDNYERDYLALFAGAKAPPAIVWSVSAMAQAAIARLAERRDNLNLPPLHVRIPVRLVPEPAPMRVPAGVSR